MKKSSSKKLRVILLVHSSLIPPEKIEDGADREFIPWITEYDVAQSLKKLGHEVQIVGIDYDLGVLRDAIVEFKPHIVYNLLMEFQDVAGNHHSVISFLELMKIPYTGCNPRGLMLASDKALCKKILMHHRLPTPKFFVVPKGNKVKIPKNTTFPLIVKSLIEEASLGISQSSVVRGEKALQDRVQFIHESIGTDAIVESYVEGREFYVGVLGNRQLKVLPVWELNLSDLPDAADTIATSRVKWSAKYRKKYKIRSKLAKDLSEADIRNIQDLCKRVYKRLGLNGYARMDLRFTPEGKIFLIEANPNPGIARKEEFPDSAQRAGINYDDLNQRVLNLGLSWFRNRK